MVPGPIWTVAVFAAVEAPTGKNATVALTEASPALKTWTSRAPPRLTGVEVGDAGHHVFARADLREIDRVHLERVSRDVVDDRGVRGDPVRRPRRPRLRRAAS